MTAQFSKSLPLVSIVTPNYNNSKYIAETIESVLKQNYPNVEHIIVDDGSTDNSLKIITEYAKKYPKKIKLISQENKGQSAAVNAGFKHASGEIIGWINSDDTYFECAISKIVEVFTNNKNAKIVFGNYVIVDSAGQKIREVQQLPIDLAAGSVLGFGRIVASSSVFWHREIFNKIGYLKEDLKYNMDGEFFSRLFFAAKSDFINHNIANFRLHSKSKTSDLSKNKVDQLNKELLVELKGTYGKLKISKIIPLGYVDFLAFAFKCKRGFLKLIYKIF